MSSSIDDLKSVCEYGFAQIDLILNRIDQSIQQLIQIARTPDQTWALEQYSIAENAFRKNLIDEALDYVNRAISGYGERSGYRLEHRFYILRGMIRIGNFKNFSSGVTDLRAATSDFLLAAKYAEHENRIDCARAFGLAGWAAYCHGEITDAERHLKKSVDINPSDDRSRFELAKVLFHVYKESEALKHFAAALRSNWKYGLRAGSDQDFLSHRKCVEDEIRKYASDIRKELECSVDEFDRFDIVSITYAPPLPH